MRINLINSVCQAFPLLIRGTDTTPLVIVHPYLHGYHGREPDPSLSPRQGLYAVPVSWGGQHLCTSYPLAWGLWADFKYRAQWTPHVHSACGANTRPSPQRTLAAAKRFNTECLRGHSMYGLFRPEIPRYILSQMAHFGVPDFSSLTSFRELPEPPRPHGVTLAGAFALRETPETDTPSSSGSTSSVVSADVPAPTESDSQAVKTLAKEHHKERVRVIERLGRETQYKIPTDHSAFSRWRLLIKTAMAGEAWEVDGCHILLQSKTTPSNKGVSGALSKLLFSCCNHSTQQIQDDFFLRGKGHDLMEGSLGCELFRLLEKTYQPSGPNWAWKWDDQLISLRHEQSESIPSFRGRLQSLVSKMGDCGIDLPPPYLVLRMLILVCRGPYHDVFDFIQTKVCVHKDPDWDLCTLDLETVSDRLDSILRRSKYYGATDTLKKGTYPSGSGSSARGAGGVDADTSDKDWMGLLNLSHSQATTVLTTHQCVICRKSDHSHLDGQCPVLRKNNLILTRITRKGSTKDASGGPKEPPGEPGKSPSSTIRFSNTAKPPSNDGGRCRRRNQQTCCR
jgi:hypothetical protein